ncbi:MAG: sulfatase-like hydrolase/transferase, partial [Planctomycetia bacterium]
KTDDRDDLPRFAGFLHWKLPEPRLGWLVDHGQWRPLVRSYLASIAFMDSQVGRLLDGLEASGKADRTVVALWSDHGWHLGEKGITGKNSLWERSTRVPLVLKGPGVKSGAECNSPVELLDLYPTLADLCGLPPPPGVEGRSLRPLLADPAAPWPWAAVTTHNKGNHAVKTEAWRYIVYADGSEELYDVKVDPHEWFNIAGDPAHAGTIQALRFHLPRREVDALPDSRGRLLTYDGETPYWEGRPIGNEEQFPKD